MDDADAYTEALPGPMTPGNGGAPYTSNDPYGRGYPASRGGATPAPQETGLSRSAKITLGAVFLSASIISAIVVVTLVVMWWF
jgi:hypothetical protein